MIWLQGLGCFAIWVLYGVARTRRAHRVRNWARRIPRATRGSLAALLLILPALFLGGIILWLAQSKGAGPHGFETWAWVLVVFMGLVYVHCHTLAAALLVTLAEPPGANG